MARALGSQPAIVLHAHDNVATALVPLAAGQTVTVEGMAIALEADIPRGHKFALRSIASGEAVVKYGQPIGRAIAPIRPGQHVHVHNVASRRAGGGEGRG